MSRWRFTDCTGVLTNKACHTVWLAGHFIYLAFYSAAEYLELVFPLFLFIHERVSSQLQLSIINMDNWRKKKVSNAERGTTPQKVHLNHACGIHKYSFYEHSNLCNGIIELINMKEASIWTVLRSVEMVLEGLIYCMISWPIFVVAFQRSLNWKRARVFEHIPAEYSWSA